MSNGTPFLPGRGRKSIGDAPGSSYGEKWYQLLDHLDKPKTKTKPKKIRLVGGLYTINQHYIKFQKKNGGMTGYYELCLNFDPVEGKFRTGEEACCPICRDFTDSDLPEELRMYGTFRYYADAFDLDKVEAGVHDGCFGVIWTNKYGRNDFVKISGTLSAGVFVDDLADGCTLFWYYDEQAKDNKDKMSFMKGEPLPVLFNQKLGQYGIKTPKGVFTGTPTDFEGIIIPKSAQEIERDLQRVGAYQRLEEYQRSVKGGYQADDAPPPPTQRGGGQAPKPRTAAPTPPPVDEDFGSGAAPSDDWENSGYAEETPASAAPAPAPAPTPPKRGPGRPKKTDTAAATAAAPPPPPAANDGWEDDAAGSPPAAGPTPPAQDFGSFDPESDAEAPPTTEVDFGDGW